MIIGEKTVGIGVKRVLLENQPNYSKRTRGFDSLRLFLGQGLLTSEGDFWRKQRRIAQPAFHHRNLQAFGAIMQEAGESLADRWETKAATGEPLPRIVVDITGIFKTEIVSNSAARVDVRDADDSGDGVTITAASVVLNGRDINADGATGFDAGFISIEATSGSVTGSGSNLSLHATGSGGGAGGSIDVSSDTSSIDLPCDFNANAGGAGGTVVSGGSIALDAATGVERWRHTRGSFVAATEGLVFVDASDGTLSILHAATGIERWSVPLPGLVGDPPVDSGGLRDVEFVGQRCRLV